MFLIHLISEKNGLSILKQDDHLKSNCGTANKPETSSTSYLD